MRKSNRVRAAESATSRPPLRERQDARGAAVTKDTRSRLTFIFWGAGILAADQLTKALAVRLVEPTGPIEVIDGVLSINVVRNPGGAFGLLPYATLFISALTIAIVVMVALWAWRTGFHPVLLGAVMGGGIGNVWDRIFRAPSPLMGHVVDFIDPSFWPAFNIADSAIVVGVALLIVSELANKKESPARE